MPRFTGDVGIGDVIVTREGPWYVQWPIRLGTALLGLPSGCNHTIIVHHRDERSGHWIGLEGRPGGVGWVDIETRLHNPITNANNRQPKTEAQRYLVATAAEQLLGVPYDWNAILADSLDALRMEELVRYFRDFKDTDLPGHVVCSAFADWAYEKVGLPNPGGDTQTRFTFPGHWDRFMINQEWKTQGNHPEKIEEMK